MRHQLHQAYGTAVQKGVRHPFDRRKEGLGRLGEGSKIGTSSPVMARSTDVARCAV
jgi:hypothetical protein